MSEEKKTIGTRRKVLQSAIAGSALGLTADKWAKPVIGSVVLPVHAETSGSGGDGTGGNTTAAPTPAPGAKIWVAMTSSLMGGGEQRQIPLHSEEHRSLLASIRSGAADVLIPQAIAGTTSGVTTTTTTRAPVEFGSITEYFLEDKGNGQFEFHSLRYGLANDTVCFTFYATGILQLNATTGLPLLQCGDPVGAQEFELIQATEGGQAIVEAGNVTEEKGFFDSRITMDWNPSGTVPSVPVCVGQNLCP